MHSKPVYGYKKPKFLTPEKYFSLPGDIKIQDRPPLSKEFIKKALNKASQLKGEQWQKRET